MSNVCNQSLYIVASCDDDYLDLLVGMLGTLKKCINASDADKTNNLGSCRKVMREINKAMTKYNPLCLLSQNPDSSSVNLGSVKFGYIKTYPFVGISMYLGWGPSYDVQKYCNALDPSKYGFASINGGEYMCSQGDETAYIQTGPKMADPSSGGLNRREFVKMRKSVREKWPNELSAFALLTLFNYESISDYYWRAHDSGLGFSASEANDYKLVDTCPLLSEFWLHPSVDDYHVVDNMVFKALPMFPLVQTIRAKDLPGYRGAERLCPGDQLRFISDWSQGGAAFDAAADECHVVFNIFDSTDSNVGATRCLGKADVNAKVIEGGLAADCDNSALDYVIACLLPHLVVTAISVSPMSLRSQTCKGPEVTVRLDFEPFDFGVILSEVHTLLSHGLSSRSLASKLPKGREQYV